MGRMYTASFSATVSAAQDLFELNAPATGVVVVHRISLGQSTDYGDAQAEQMRITIARTSTSGSGGSAVTARPMEVGDAAFAGTVEANNTTQSTIATVLYEESWNVQGQFLHVPTPEERIVIAPSGRICVIMRDAPADALGIQGTITFEEIG